MSESESFQEEFGPFTITGRVVWQPEPKDNTGWIWTAHVIDESEGSRIHMKEFGQGDINVRFKTADEAKENCIRVMKYNLERYGL